MEETLGRMVKLNIDASFFEEHGFRSSGAIINDNIR
jgi:hypothetical protein